MTWISLTKPTFLVTSFFKGFIHGLTDEVACTFTDADITRFKDSADLLRNCEPWENHLKEQAYSEINKALEKKNYQDARNAISKYVTETADPSCITTLKMAVVDLCTKCTTLLKEAIPKQIIVLKP